MLDLARDGHLHILTLRGGENRLRLETISQWNGVLDQVLRDTGDGAGALIVIGEGKFWSNGIDLDWLTSAAPDEQRRYVPSLLALLGRLLTFPVPTVAALSGHAFAAGAMLALAMDYRTMRTGRGWFCLPEVDIHIPFHHAMLSLIKLKLSFGVVRDAVLQGKRFAAEDALALGVVDAIAEDAALLGCAKEFAQSLAMKQRAIFERMKVDLYGDVARELMQELTKLNA